MRRLIARFVVAAGLAAAAFAAPAAPATAAACATDSGVTVVVDFNDLGGGVRTACVAGGGGDRASTLFPDAGFALDYVQRQPGFVCRVSGTPSDNPCVNTPPADAYWSLWWSDGKSGSWSYATAGASGLTVPDGGYVGFSWQGSSSRSAPSLTPAPRVAPTPSPTQQPTQQPSGQPSHQPTQQPSSGPSQSAPGSTGSAAPSDPASPSAHRSGQAGDGKRPKQGASASAHATHEATEASPSATDESVSPTSAEPPDAGGGGLPTWVAPIVVLALFGAAGGVALVRRRRSGPA